MNAAKPIAKRPENEGVDYIFGVPGEENLDLTQRLGALAVLSRLRA